MQLTFLGAAGDVTGSAFLLRTDRARVLLDFGLHQGGPAAELRNRRALPRELSRLDAVVLSHAHVDHAGRLPQLPAAGFRGPIWSTPATADLCGLLLPDSAQVQAHDAAAWARRHASRRGPREPPAPPPLPPLYTLAEAQDVLRQFETLAYGVTRAIADGVTLRLHDAGHILGSAVTELELEDGARRVRLVYSGDVGGAHAPLLRDPVTPDAADVLLMESTYGDRDHRPPVATLREFAQILGAAHAQGGKVLVPSFAVGRTQQLLFHLAAFRRAGTLPAMPIFVDSPMAVSTTELYRRHREVFDAETQALIASGHAPLDFPGLRFCRTAEESIALNTLQGPAVIIAASGMLTGGRIVHHLRHHGGSPDTHVVIVGFQAHRTPGRALVQGARSVRLMGREVEIRAQVHTLGGFSAHAGQSELVGWAAPLRASAPRTFLVHGEDPAREALSALLRRKLALAAESPQAGMTVTL